MNQLKTLFLSLDIQHVKNINKDLDAKIGNVVKLFTFGRNFNEVF